MVLGKKLNKVLGNDQVQELKDFGKEKLIFEEPFDT
jgi:hypothetical protein